MRKWNFLNNNCVVLIAEPYHARDIVFAFVHLMNFWAAGSTRSSTMCCPPPPSPLACALWKASNGSRHRLIMCMKSIDDAIRMRWTHAIDIYGISRELRAAPKHETRPIDKIVVADTIDDLQKNPFRRFILNKLPCRRLATIVRPPVCGNYWSQCTLMTHHFGRNTTISHLSTNHLLLLLFSRCQSSSSQQEFFVRRSGDHTFEPTEITNRPKLMKQ